MFDDPVADTLCTLAKARVKGIRGDFAGALEDVEEATTHVGHAPWLVDRLRIETGHLRVATGEPELALLELEGVRTTGSEAEIALVTSQVTLVRGGDPAETLTPALHQAAPLVIQVEAGWPPGRSAVGRVPRPDRRRPALRMATNERRIRLPFRQATADVRRLLRETVCSRRRTPGWPATTTECLRVRSTAGILRSSAQFLRRRFPC